MDILYVGIGGALGSIVRYRIGRAIARKLGSGFPWGTFIINLSGAVLLGLASSFDADKNVQLLLADGFLGAYTTFSTFMYEGFQLFRDDRRKNAFVYIAGTFLLGVIGFAIGFGMSRAIR